MGGQVESEEQSGERRTERRARNRAESEEQSGERGTERRARNRAESEKEEGYSTALHSPALRSPHYALYYGHQSFHQGFLFLRTALSGEFPVIATAGSLKYLIAESAYV